MSIGEVLDLALEPAPNYGGRVTAASRRYGEGGGGLGGRHRPPPPPLERDGPRPAGQTRRIARLFRPYRGAAAHRSWS